MGVDKSNIRTVIHLAPPGSAEAYLQESGRASRDGKGANAWLIWTQDDLVDRKKPGDSEGDSANVLSVKRTDQAFIEAQLSSFIKPFDAETVIRARRDAMVGYASSTDTCRREILLESLGIEAQDCSGCDVCGGEHWTEAPEREAILKVVWWNRGRFRKGQLARILTGRRSMEIRRIGLDSVRGFGALKGWELEDAEEALAMLLQSGELRFGRYWRKGRLVPGKTRRFLCRNSTINTGKLFSGSPPAWMITRGKPRSPLSPPSVSDPG